MVSSREAARCTVRDGAVYMRLNNECVHIPSHLWSKSELLKDAVSSVADASVTDDFTLAAPRAWLQAWVDYYGKKEHALADASIQKLVNCLMVRFCTRNLPSVALAIACVSEHASTLLRASCVLCITPLNISIAYLHTIASCSRVVRVKAAQLKLPTGTNAPMPSPKTVHFLHERVRSAGC
jgi:hypothetical protein